MPLYDRRDDEPARSRSVAVPPTAREEPRRLVPVGPRGARESEGRGQAHPALDRLLGLPLVPRDGARVVRERGDREADERALREHQGRPRGAPRPRPDLPARRAAHGPLGRLAAHGVSHARSEAVLRGHVFPAGGSLRHARLPEVLDAVADAYRTSAATSSCRRASSRRRSAAWASSRTRGDQAYTLGPDLLEKAARKLSSRFDERHGGFGTRPKFPNTMCLEVLLRRGVLEDDDEATRDACRARARRHARGRHLGSPAAAASTATRPTSAGSCRTSRRCSTTTRCLLRLYADAATRVRSRSVRRDRERHRDVAAHRDAGRRRRFLRHAGRRLRGRGRASTSSGPRRQIRGSPRRRRARDRGREALFRRDRGGEFRAQRAPPCSPRTAASRAWPTARPHRRRGAGRARPREACVSSPRAKRASGPFATRRSSRAGTGSSSVRSPRPGPRSANRRSFPPRRRRSSTRSSAFFSAAASRASSKTAPCTAMGFLDDHAVPVRRRPRPVRSDVRPEARHVAARAIADEIVARFWDAAERGFYFTPSDGENLILPQPRTRSIRPCPRAARWPRSRS